MDKQYMVLRVASTMDQGLNLTPLAGLFTWQAAQLMVEQVRQADPEAVLMVQEVGAA